MATRIETKGRTVARPQSTVEYDEATSAVTDKSGKVMRSDKRGYPDSFGINTTAQEYTFVADD